MNIDKTMESPDIQPEKIKVSSIYVIASEHCNKPYYEIRYKEVGNDFYNIGYSSFNLEQVLYWRHRCFEVVPTDEYERRDAKDTNVPGKWIPISERLPKPDKYILLSFSNYSGLVIGRYEEDDGGGAFYEGDSLTPLTQYDVFVNAWMPLPEPCREME